mmetsp:Transcript_2445/g.9204  ORF Transcript_2445/g.9204 Transcript_2445/m.9204 type:complete len:237 (-) Transcript_2445:630-1340(-)
MNDKQVGVEVVREWPIKWTINDDCNLLRGVLKYGLGNWEQIREDEKLGLKYKICPEHSNAYKRAKPQQIQRRVEVLLSDIYSKFHKSTDEDLQNAQKPSIMKIRIKKRTKSSDNSSAHISATAVSSTLSEAECESMLSFIGDAIEHVRVNIAMGGADIEESVRIIGESVAQMAHSVPHDVEGARAALWHYVEKKVGDHTVRQLYASQQGSGERKRKRSPGSDETHEQQPDWKRVSR